MNQQESEFHDFGYEAGVGLMPLTLHPDMLSRKALAAGFGGENHQGLTGG
jgi:hypothetical protein